MTRTREAMTTILTIVQRCGMADYTQIQQEIPGLSYSKVATYLQRASHRGLLLAKRVGKRNIYSITSDGEAHLLGDQDPPEIHGVGPSPFKPVAIPKITSVWQLGSQ